MNFQSLIYPAIVTSLLFTGCTSDNEPELNLQSPVTFEITDGGFGNSSRASETEYCTEFTPGDACGLYIVHNGRSVYENIRIVASDGKDGTVNWSPKSPVSGGLEGETYFLYYPYQDNMTGKVNISADNAVDFFAPLVESWEVRTDQSHYANYTASDLMTAKGTAKSIAETLHLSFSMTHRMSLAVIEMPTTHYSFTDKSIKDYISPFPAPVDFSASPVIPFRTQDGTYRLILNTQDSPTTITGAYNQENKAFKITPSEISAGGYKTYIVDGGKATVLPETYALQAGDFFCKDSNSDWYIIPKDEVPDGNVIGVVFYAGLHSTDSRSSYNIALVDGGPKLPEDVFHGYVIALTDVNNDTDDQLAWLCGPNKEYKIYTGTSTTDTDWKGYQNCYNIKAYVNSHNGWDMKHFPAVLACLTYGNRSENLNGNPTNAYAWQQPLSAPNNSSGWFLPSAGQLAYLSNNQSLLSECIANIKNHTYSTKAYWYHIQWFNQKFWYWSSTERTGDNNMFTRTMDFKYGMQSSSKDIAKPTRAILAF